MVLDGSGEVREINPTAQHVLARETELARFDDLERVRSAIKRLLGRAKTRLPADMKAWITVPAQDGRSLVVHQIPRSGTDELDTGTVLILLDPAGCAQPSAMVLRRMYGLTAAEAKLAIQIARGQTLAEIAADHQVSMTTVRRQLAFVLSKTETNRQAELMALLARVSILP
jgi:DNA-binding CsgD family transcriptional regulator